MVVDRQPIEATILRDESVKTSAGPRCSTIQSSLIDRWPIEAMSLKLTADR